VAQGAINLNQPERDMTRTELTLGQIAAEWRYQPRGEQFAQALLSFLQSVGSADTLRSYSFSILQFFGWYWQRHRRLATPDRITRGDASEFNRWLRTRDVRLTKWWLERDPERRADLQIYDFVARNPGTNLDELSKQMGVYTPERRAGLAHRLACLTKRRALQRTPSVAEYRRANGGAIVQPPVEIFRYTVSTVSTAAGPERASTVMTRLSALGSLWSFMIRSGENAPGATEPLLRHNIWIDGVKQARAQAPSHQEANRQAKKPSLELFLRILATTYARTHGPAALQAAQAAFLGRPEVPGRRMMVPTFKDIRDRALLLFMAQTGARAREIGSLRRRDVAGEPAVVTIVGKRGKKRVIMMPPAVLLTLRELSAKLRSMAAQQARYGGSGRADDLLGDSAPLFPAVAGIALLLNRRAEAAGIDPGSPLFQKAHPHGLRALFITYALETGTPINRVQAIAGHASVATTGRYAEERKPEALIAEAFRGARAAAVAPAPVVAPRAAAAAERVSAEAWRPKEEAIAPPAPPRPRQERVRRRIEPPAPPVAEPEPRLVPRREPRPEKPVAHPLALAGAPDAAAQVQSLAQQIARWRNKPITAREERTLEKCVGVADESLRNLCVIYDIHWGEVGNRQVVVERTGRKYKPNVDYEDVDEDDDEDEDEEEYEPFDYEAALEEVNTLGMARVTEIARAGSGQLFAEAGTEKLNRIYSGKNSGLSWWTGTQGRLKPDMPVMSPEQVGTCTELSQDVICVGLVKLWQSWFTQSPTKAEALVRWLGVALDTAAQLEAEVLRRGANWVPSDAPWPLTRFEKREGRADRPMPRMAFRQHLPGEIVAWFKARAWEYHVSPGSPEDWEKKTEQSKPRGQLPADWYVADDPVTSLPLDERRAMLDWVLALSGQLPVDREPRFGIEGRGYMASREEIARWLWALCQFDQSIDGLRDSERFGPQYTASLFQRKSVDEMPTAVRLTFMELQEQARDAMRDATAGRVSDFDAYSLIKKRVKGGKSIAAEAKQQERERKRVQVAGEERVRIGPELWAEAEAEEEAAAEEEAVTKARFIPNAPRSTWMLEMARQYFGDGAAADPALKLVAKCGVVPLATFQDLFRVSGGTISHTLDFKRAFAEQFGSHSECVARRIARQLWEIKQGRAAPKEAVTKPQHMVTLVQVMRTFKVPCTPGQAHELRQLAPWLDRPEGIYQQYAKVRTAPGAERDELSEAQLQERELAEQYEEAIAGAMRAEHFQTFEKNPRQVALPTPVHLMLALV
jgi:integrase